MALISSKEIARLARQPQIHYPFKNVPSRKSRVGKMVISESIILDWLQFPKARIRHISFNELYGTIVIVLEDREMPEVIEGDAIPIITPVYTATYRKGKIVKVKREKRE